MSPSLKKVLVAALTLVAFVSLTLNLILLDRLRRTNTQVVISRVLVRPLRGAILIPLFLQVVADF
jgi:hypothetical protein